MARQGRRHCGSSSRRDVLAIMGLLGSGWAAGGSTASAQPASERPKEGDLLVSAESETVLAPTDVPLAGPPVLAWPMDATNKTVRKDSRLNKILLLRFDPATLVGATKERAAEGVVGYSAICPHTACQVDGWMADQQILECSCHYSHYDPREGAAVIDGPSPRALPALPLKIMDGKLAVAKPFTSRVGIIPS
jgi:rieske iron-sulfur protein